MAWRLAKSLEVLRNQVNAAYPNRSKISDGTIGDAAHQAVPSDHNPNADGVVCALDLTHDPANMDAHALADALLAIRHPDLKYIISNYRIAGDWTGWQWWRYYGVDPHDTHIHISVGVGDDGQSQQPYDDTNNWNVKEGNDMITKDDVGPVRIIMSEVEGWNGNDIHSGKNDSQIMGAWVGHDFREMLWHCWNIQTTHRQQIVDYANNLSSQLKTTTDKLAQISAKADLSDSLQKQVADLTAKNQALVTQQTTDQETGNAIMRFLGKLFRTSS